jgi:outer membrane protein OmpA-like peptidoglycan-associated protein
MGGVTIGSATPSGVTAATFTDAPSWDVSTIPPGQTTVRSFELAVVCVETGETFGSLDWGYTKTSGFVVTLTGGKPTDVHTAGATADVETTRRSFYSSFFQHSISGFARGSHAIPPAQRATLATIAALANVRKVTLIGANDFSGGAEDNADLSLRRANAVRDELVRQGVPTANIVVEGHGAEAREPNARGAQVAANRRVDVHLDRGTLDGTHGDEGSAIEGRRLRRQDPRVTIGELVDLLFQLQRRPGRIPASTCNQITHLVDGIERWRRLDPTVPDVRSVYGPLLTALRSRCDSGIPRAPVDIPIAPLEPPSFVPRILDDARRVP